MLHRRRVIQSGLAAGSLPFAAPFRAFGQRRSPLKVRYNEVVRSLLYVPAYVAITKGFFAEAGIEPILATGQGGDKTMAALLSNAADVALIGPETAIYVLTGDSPTKVRIFCGLTSTDGFMLMGREKAEKFNWSMLKGKDILGFRPGSTPILFFEAAMRQNGIDPQKDVKLVNNVAIPARVGSWLSGQNQYGIFIEPDAAQLELDGKAYFLASIGETVGPADYTSFMATDKYIRENPDVIQGWTSAVAKAMKWTQSATTAEIVDSVKEFFPGVNPQALAAASDRYRRLNIWKANPVIDPGPIDKFQDILVAGDVLAPGKRVKFQDLVLTEYANKAK
jgi:NitT/TauT family transport system substrate-binding protein